MNPTMTQPVTGRLGRLPRTYNPRVPHLSALVAGKPLPPPPVAVDWTKGMPASLGMMLNDRLDNCTCAAIYHALQVWSFNARSRMLNLSDAEVEQLYIQACGYQPASKGEGPGATAQQVLSYVLKHGVPTGSNTNPRQKIAAFVELDPRHLDDVKRSIHECGLVYIGFNLPQSVAPPGTQSPPVWKYIPGKSTSIGGHAVVLAGYDVHGARFISWGQYFTMTWEFFAQYVEEAYAIAAPEWVEQKGTTPAGLNLAQLESQMAALKEQ